MENDWEFKIIRGKDINFEDYCMLLIWIYENCQNSFIDSSLQEFWNKKQYDLINKLYTKYKKKYYQWLFSNQEKPRFIDFFENVNEEEPFFSIIFNQYKFEMYLDPEKTITTPYPITIDNNSFKQKVFLIQKNIEQKFREKFRLCLSEDITLNTVFNK